MSNGNDFDAMSDSFARLAENLRRMGDDLRYAIDEATEGSYPAQSPDGSVRAVVNGRGRLTDLYLGPHLLQCTPDEIDRVVTEVVNRALAAARAGSQQVLLGALPTRIGAEIEETMDSSRREANQ